MPLAVVVEADFTHPTRAQPAQQSCGTLIDLDPAALGASALAREDHDHLITVEQLLRLAAVEVPDIADVRAPAHDALVTVVHSRVEHPLG